MKTLKIKNISFRDESDKNLIIKEKHLTIIDIDNTSQLNDETSFQYVSSILEVFYLELKSIFINDIVLKLNSDQFLIISDVNIDKELEDILQLKKTHSYKYEDVEFFLTFHYSSLYSCSKANSETHINNLGKSLSIKKIYGYNPSIEDIDNIFLTSKEFIKMKTILLKAFNDNFKDIELKLFKQEIVNIQGINEKKYEILIRLKNENEIISPYFFLELSKKINLYKDISLFVFNAVFKLAKENKNISYGINISKNDIDIEDTFNFLVKNFEKHMEGNIILEITETEEFSANGLKRLKSLIDSVKKFKNKVAIDDFGAGYSNFNYIASLNPDIVKIDGSLIKNISDSNTLTIIQGMVHMSKQMGFKIVAEFVDSQEILDKVRELGIDYAQGFFLHKPEEI